MAVVHRLNISLTQRNDRVKRTVSVSRDIVLLVRDESRIVCGKHLGFYLNSSSHTLSNS